MPLLGENTADNIKLKFLLVFHYENPKAFKGYSKFDVLIIWFLNEKAWKIGNQFEE